VLKGRMVASKKGISLRKSLVIFQFALAIFLISGTIVVYKQVEFMFNQNLGMKLNQVLVMDRPGRWDKSDSVNGNRVKQFKGLLKNDPSIESVAMSDAIPGKEIRTELNYRIKDKPTEPYSSIKTMGIDEDYLSLVGTKILAGRNFSPSFKTDDQSLVITRSAAVELGFENPEDAVGKQLSEVWNGDVLSFSIIGVTEDFHNQSLEKKMEPVVFQFNGSDYEADEYYLVKLKTTGIQHTVGFIQSTWSDVFKGNPFNFFFLDEYFNQQYKTDVEFGWLFGTFSMLAIGISCIGLLALVAFMIKQRTKEIGIRKVLGARVRDIIFLLSGDFLKLVLLANIIAWPLGWLLMSDWLTDFAYRTKITWWIFIISGSATLVIALLTISVQALQAAIQEPARTLRTE
ncbi:MAG TPA: FtsX-like permease family protein, partial [Puia sp.]|nr:FtsX-like permease family protein [Puia sp.]